MSEKIILFIICILLGLCPIISAEETSDDSMQMKPKKDIRDYNDADFARLYDQWEEGEEPLEDDELPEYRRPKPEIDISKVSSPEELLRMSKKGQPVMAFVTVSGNPTREETDSLSALWQTSLQNSHLSAERVIIEDNRILFVFKDGSQAWEAKEFFVEQELCEEVMIENIPYSGKGAKQPNSEL